MPEFQYASWLDCRFGTSLKTGQGKASPFTATNHAPKKLAVGRRTQMQEVGHLAFGLLRISGRWEGSKEADLPLNCNTKKETHKSRRRISNEQLRGSWEFHSRTVPAYFETHIAIQREKARGLQICFETWPSAEGGDEKRARRRNEKCFKA